METKFYPSRLAFIKDLATRVDGIDVNKSLFMTVFGFVTTEGKEYRCPNAISFAESFNKEFGDVIDSKLTRTAGGRNKLMVAYLDRPTEEVKEDVVEAVKAPTEDVITSPTEEVIEASTEDLIKEDIKDPVEQDKKETVVKPKPKRTRSKPKT